MPVVTIAVGILLVILSVISYFATHTSSITVWIPAFFGLVLFLAGLTARDETKMKHAMHAAAAVGLLGFLGTIPGVIKLFTMLSGGTVARPEAVIAQSVMAAILFIFVLLCVKSFIDARRARRAA